MSQQTADQPQQDILTDHAYDGIQEYDNPMPGWWVWLFIATIAFSVVYFLVATLTGGQMSAEGVYKTAMAAQLKSGGTLKSDAPTLMGLMKDDETLKIGTAVFATNCTVCHNRDASGSTGPNLTDDYYLNVKSLAEIPDVIAKGRNNGAMPGWSNKLSPNEIVQVSAFVASLRGQNKPGRPHEGVQIPPWSASPAPTAAAAPTSAPAATPAPAPAAAPAAPK